MKGGFFTWYICRLWKNTVWMFKRGDTSFQRADSYLGSLEVEGLGIVTEEHDVLFQVSQTPVFVVSDAVLWA